MSGTVDLEAEFIIAQNVGDGECLCDTGSTDCRDVLIDDGSRYKLLTRSSEVKFCKDLEELESMGYFMVDNGYMVTGDPVNGIRYTCLLKRSPLGGISCD